MASLATIFRQVAREGARWGLYPVMRDGCVKVCELVDEIHERPAGCMVIPRKVERVICSLDDNSPMDAFAGVLRHRLRREHHDFMKLVRAREERLRREQIAELDARRRDFRAKLERQVIRGRIMNYGRLGLGG